MDLIKIGKFITLLRKEKGLTQAQLAEKLGVTDKSVSKWERGICLPDNKARAALLKFFDITILELYEGERNPNLTDMAMNATAESATQYFEKRESKKMRKAITMSLLAIVIVIFGGCLLFTLTTYNQYSAFSIRTSTNDYVGKGSMILTKEKTIITLMDLKVYKEEIANIQALSFEYTLSLDNVLIATRGDLFTPVDENGNTVSLSNIIENISIYVEQDVTSHIAKKEIVDKELELTIKYLTEDLNEEQYTMKFSISKSFSNNKIVL